MRRAGNETRSGRLLEVQQAGSRGGGAPREDQGPQRSPRHAAISLEHSRMKQLMSEQVPMLPTAQLTTWSRKKRESAQV